MPAVNRRVAFNPGTAGEGSCYTRNGVGEAPRAGMLSAARMSHAAGEGIPYTHPLRRKFNATRQVANQRRTVAKRSCQGRTIPLMGATGGTVAVAVRRRGERCYTRHHPSSVRVRRHKFAQPNRRTG